MTTPSREEVEAAAKACEYQAQQFREGAAHYRKHRDDLERNARYFDLAANALRLREGVTVTRDSLLDMVPRITPQQAVALGAHVEALNALLAALAKGEK